MLTALVVACALGLGALLVLVGILVMVAVSRVADALEAQNAHYGIGQTAGTAPPELPATRAVGADES